MAIQLRHAQIGKFGLKAGVRYADFATWYPKNQCAPCDTVSHIKKSQQEKLAIFDGR
jgi:hypothetical protein